MKLLALAFSCLIASVGYTEQGTDLTADEIKGNMVETTKSGKDMDQSAFFEKMYTDFNNRNIDLVLEYLAKDANWPNGMTGGREIGHEAIKSYWTHQWSLINSKVAPISITSTDEGAIVQARQIIKQPDGKLISDSIVSHTYTLKDGKISKMEINALSSADKPDA